MKLSQASLHVLEDLSSGPKRLFYLNDELYGWKALEKLGFVERFGEEILGWARLTDKGKEFMKKQNVVESKLLKLILEQEGQVMSEDELLLKAEDIYSQQFPVTYRYARGFFNIPGLYDVYLLLVADVNFDEFGDDIRDFRVINVESDKDITNELDDSIARELKLELLSKMDN